MSMDFWRSLFVGIVPGKALVTMLGDGLFGLGDSFYMMKEILRTRWRTVILAHR